MLIANSHKQQIFNVIAKVTAFICSLESLSAFIFLLLRRQTGSAARGLGKRKETDEITALKELKFAVLLRLNTNIVHLDSGFLVNMKLQDYVS